jgi:hypothetical protein
MTEPSGISVAPEVMERLAAIAFSPTDSVMDLLDGAKMQPDEFLKQASAILGESGASPELLEHLADEIIGGIGLLARSMVWLEFRFGRDADHNEVFALRRRMTINDSVDKSKGRMIKRILFGHSGEDTWPGVREFFVFDLDRDRGNTAFLCEGIQQFLQTEFDREVILKARGAQVRFCRGASPTYIRRVARVVAGLATEAESPMPEAEVADVELGPAAVGAFLEQARTRA